MLKNFPNNLAWTLNLKTLDVSVVTVQYINLGVQIVLSDNALKKGIDSKIKVIATLQNSGDADGIAAVRYKTYCNVTTFETQGKEVFVPAPWNT